ncbi:MAG TPA: SDR family oxidoreductase [Candidatus Paceibacterota bacterium]|nr:SDR family oxidoreductase [Candidatus Paceibacterota bacterium]
MKKRAVIVTGGGRGLGRIIAERLVESLNVFIVGRTESDLRDTCSALKAKGHEAAYFVGDVSLPTTADNAIAALEELGWDIAALVCNAGIGKSRPTHELENAEWQHILDVNLNGSFYFSKAVLPLMKEQKSGVLCFISSIAGVRGYAYEAAYAASKHAVVGLAKSIAAEYGKHGIVSVALCPNFIDGEMTERTINGLAQRRGITAQEAREVIEQANPQKRIIPPEEVAEMVANICTNKVPLLSGTAIVMGGGGEL